MQLAPLPPALAARRSVLYILNWVFEWDLEKARRNGDKHAVTFDEAASAFDDPDGLDGEDLAHSTRESRRLRLACSGTGRVLVVAYTVRGDAVRIISARLASRKERQRYGKA